MNDNHNVSSAFASWNTKSYIAMTHMNIGISYELMKLGYNVHFADPDVILSRDPFPHLLWQNMHYVHTMEVVCDLNQDWDYFWKSGIDGNTGFTFVRSNPRTLALWEKAIEDSMNQKQTIKFISGDNCGV